MPYSKMDDINPALRGIKPPITLEQANHIASVADAIRGQFAWPTAISQFRKTYTVVRGRWVRRNSKEQQ